MTYPPLLRGEYIRLTALEKPDVMVMHRWYQDPDFLRPFDASVAFPRGKDQLEELFGDIRKTDNNYFFAIRPLEDETLIGVAELDGILWSHGTAWLAIGIGNANMRNQGYGTEAMTLLLDFAFRELNLHRIQLSVFANNPRAIRVYENLGFQREGVFREFLHRDGQRYDMLLYGILRREWEASE